MMLSVQQRQAIEWYEQLTDEDRAIVNTYLQPGDLRLVFALRDAGKEFDSFYVQPASDQPDEFA